MYLGWALILLGIPLIAIRKRKVQQRRVIRSQQIKSGLQMEVMVPCLMKALIFRGTNSNINSKRQRYILWDSCGYYQSSCVFTLEAVLVQL